MLPEIPRDVQQAADRACMIYLRDPNVSLIDIGWRICDSEGYVIKPELCVRVHLRNKLSGDAFRAFAARYPRRVIDPNLIGYTVDIPGRANYVPHLVTGFSVSFTSRVATIVNPMCGGISISNALVYGAGTLGGFVQDRDDPNKIMILSNWHVLASLWASWQSLAIYQPGQLDGGYGYNIVAYLTRHAMDQNLDAAVASLTGSRNIINQQRGLGSVTGVTTPHLGMHVVKSGRTTGVTSGIIDGIGGRRMFNYGGVSRMIREHIHIVPALDGTPSVSSPGDSGAWWLEESTHRAVGLHFGGNNYPEYGLAFSMPAVLDALHVDLAE